MTAKPKIKANTTFKQVMIWIETEALTYMDFLNQIEWRQRILKLERAVIKKSML